MDLPGISAGKESACNTGDPSLIPGLGRSPGEGIGYPLRYSWVYLMAQMAKTLSAMQETRVQFLGRENHLEMATHSSILAGESHGQRRLVGYSPCGRRDLEKTK